MKYQFFCCLSVICFSAYSMEKSNQITQSKTVEGVVKNVVKEETRKRLELLTRNPILSEKRRREWHNDATVVFKKRNRMG